METARTHRARTDGSPALSCSRGGRQRAGLLRWLVSLLGALGLWSTSVPAQSTRAEPAEDCAGEPAAAPQTRPEQIAQLYQRFECHFVRREYAACLPFLEEACVLTDSPRCLLNLGAVHHALMHCQLARSFYERYLDRSPYDEEVQAAVEALEELKAACPNSIISAGVESELAPPVAPPVIAPPFPAGDTSAGAANVRNGSSTGLTKPGSMGDGARVSKGDHVLAWSLLGAGAASLTVTLVAAAQGARAEGDAEARDASNGDLGLAEDPEMRAIDRQGRRYNQLAAVFGVASGVLLGAATVAWIAEVAPGAAFDVSADGSACVSYAGHF